MLNLQQQTRRRVASWVQTLIESQFLLNHLPLLGLQRHEFELLFVIAFEDKLYSPLAKQACPIKK